MSRRRLSARSPLVALALLSALVVVSLSLSACNVSTPPTVPPSAQNTTSPTVEPSTLVTSTTPTFTPRVRPAPTTTVKVYLVRGEFLGVGMARTAPASSPAKTAMLELLAGPNSSEKAMKLGTQIPKGTKLLGLSISGGVATVNLSKQFESGGGSLSMTLRVAQVVNTLTQFKNVKKVAFKLDGKKVKSIGGEGLIVDPPVGRADYEGALPAIMLESPLPGGGTGGNVFLITGSANVFEAQFRVRLTDAAGKVIADQSVMATSGTGTRGTFNARVMYKMESVKKYGECSLTVYELSAKDGTEINVVKIPLTILPPPTR